MTSDKMEFINRKIEEIDNKLKDVSLSDLQHQMLDKERAEYVEQKKELEHELEENDEESTCEVVEECIESEESDPEYESFYFKYCFEHCTNIDDIIHTLESLKEYFEQLKNEGHELTQPVDSGYCFIDKICQD